MRTFPSSGAMAVWTALALCKRVAIAGFGSGCDADGPGPTDVYYKTGDIGSKSLYAFHDMHTASGRGCASSPVMGSSSGSAVSSTALIAGASLTSD